MINRLIQLYPNAIFASKPSSDLRFLWFKDNDHNQYIGIPDTDLTQNEINLLQLFFPKTDMEDLFLFSKTTRLWREFLLLDGPVPSSHMEHCRIIHFSIADIREEFQYEEWEEAVKSLFPYEIIIVPFSKQEGVIIEERRDLHLAEDDLISAIQAFESDFFFKVHFYIGSFQKLDKKIKQLFKLEQSIFQLSHSEQPEERIFTLEKLIPLYLYSTIPIADRNIMFTNIHSLFAEDPEYSETIKLYIENQSNATLTAKQLFMHRNSLQYRIDKFIERTGIDIKTFHGAFFAYLGCLHLNRK